MRDQAFGKMFRYCCVILLSCTLIVDGQPLSCEEDAHCSEGYYCKFQEKMCYQCLQCEDLNRLMPLSRSEDSCVKSAYDCGPCFEGFVNICESDVKGMCVLPHWFQHEPRTSLCLYIWTTAVITGVLIVVIFIYVLWNTYVYQIIPNYDTSTTAPPNDQPPIVVPPKNILKQMLLFFKNVTDRQ